MGTVALSIPFPKVGFSADIDFMVTMEEHITLTTLLYFKDMGDMGTEENLRVMDRQMPQ